MSDRTIKSLKCDLVEHTEKCTKRKYPIGGACTCGMENYTDGWNDALDKALAMSDTESEEPCHSCERMEMALREIAGGSSADSWYGRIARAALRGDHE